MSTPVSSTFDGLASVDRYGNLAPIVVDRLDERYPNSAQTGERIGAVEESVGQRVHVGDTYVGVTQQPGATMKDKLHAACKEATERGGTVMLPPGIIDVGTGFSMAGYTCGLIGQGAAGHSAERGSTLRASNQSGPVLDLDGWKFPPSFSGRMDIGGFSLGGSGVADPTGTNTGLSRIAASMASVHIFDIAVKKTGGPCFDFRYLYLSMLSRLTCMNVVGAEANNIPWFRAKSSNGNTIVNLGFRSELASGDVGKDGALWIGEDDTYPTEGNQWIGTWLEYLHATDGGTLIQTKGATQEFIGTYFVDCSKNAGATGTSHVRFSPGSRGDFGGNSWSGLVPGRSNTTTAIDYGIDVHQNNNRIVGVRGFKENNVRLNPGVRYTYVSLQGSQAAANGPAVEDLSGFIDNYIYESRTGRTVTNGTIWDYNGTLGPRISLAANPANANLHFGNAGNSLRAVGMNTYWDTTQVNLRNAAMRVYARFIESGAPCLTLTPGTDTYPALRLDAGTGIEINAGGIKRPVTTKTASAPLGATEEISMWNGSNIVATLPNPANATGREFVVKNLNATPLTVRPGVGSIDGDSSVTLQQWGYLRVLSDGAGWRRVGGTA